MTFGWFGVKGYLKKRKAKKIEEEKTRDKEAREEELKERLRSLAIAIETEIRMDSSKFIWQAKHWPEFVEKLKQFNPDIKPSLREYEKELQLWWIAGMHA